jgi:cytochrome P450
MRTAANFMTLLNPPEHTRIRRAVTPFLPTEVLGGVEQTARTITERALFAGRSSGGLEVVRELAIPIALSVISELLGVAPADRRRAMGWTFKLNKAIDSPVPMRATKASDFPAVVRHQGLGIRALTALPRSVRYAELALGRTYDDKSTVLVQSLQALVVDGIINTQEAAAIWLQSFIAGLDTVQTMIVNTIWLLGNHPEQYELLAEDTELIPGAIEEVLRFESPTRLLGRVVGHDIELSGHYLAAGDDVVVIRGAAHRDAEIFPDAQSFDITRSPKHLTFGHGVHFCLGAPLARVEVGGALRGLIEVLGEQPLRVLGHEWRRSFSMRGLDRVQLEL